MASLRRGKKSYIVQRGERNFVPRSGAPDAFPSSALPLIPAKRESSNAMRIRSWIPAFAEMSGMISPYGVNPSSAIP